ncbi:1,4-dihydroxy-2-naphthoate octaprenyltransferase [Magnetospirillum sp. UT-4]|uniref:1,4-dihydroxy-2-naphthoate octaprenyltransferase n=1 Tax=Magnetospirillum sp. UT-4 TaxID=2681467 RepID=UPI00137F352A|nr:1,4-dihydroxy-2-naphthoate octaprenyltransferase [Magnetospirillum sp. UT-4]CAA7626611.1 1,4-dihydroxy-2-naphthoate octaprenyltransferase [Magnetospirillum sp. UT-4]
MRIEPGAPPPEIAVPGAEPASRSDRPPTGWRLWLVAARPRTLSIAVAPVVLGAALAQGGWGAFRPLPLLATLLAALLIQAGTNLWNDVGDAIRGGDQPMRQGPPRVTALGWASPARVRAAASACFGLAGLLGLYLGWLGGWPVLALGAASLLAGWAYSGGPFPIAYTALGEAFVVAFFGVGAVAGTVWLQAEAMDAATLAAGFAIGLPAAAVLMVNNFRDLEPDRLAGRRTLAIRLGPDGARAVYAILMMAPLALLPPAGAGWPVLLAAPEAVRLILAFAREPRGPGFNRILAQTARYQLLLAGLAALGLLA